MIHLGGCTMALNVEAQLNEIAQHVDVASRCIATLNAHNVRELFSRTLCIVASTLEGISRTTFWLKQPSPVHYFGDVFFITLKLKTKFLFRFIFLSKVSKETA